MTSSAWARRRQWRLGASRTTAKGRRRAIPKRPTIFGQTPASWDRWSIGCSNGGRPVTNREEILDLAAGLLRADDRIQQDDLPAILQTAVDRYLALIARPDVCTLFSQGHRWHEVPVTCGHGVRTRGRSTH